MLGDGDASKHNGDSRGVTATAAVFARPPALHMVTVMIMVMVMVMVTVIW